MEQKIVMFDFDTTIVDSLKYWYQVPRKEMLDRYGAKPIKGFMKMRKGLTNEEVADLIVKLTGIKATSEDILQEIYASMEYNYLNKVKLISGAKEYLLELKASGKKLVLASATEEFLLKTALKHFGIDVFDEIFAEPSIGLRKRDSKFFDVCMKKLNASADEIFFFEDSYSSIKSATSKGISCCAIIHKYNKEHKDEFEKFCKAVIKDYKTIKKIEL